MTTKLRALLLAGAAPCAVTPASAHAAETATEVDEVVVSGRLEESLPQTLAQYGNKLVTVDGETVRQGLFVDVGQVLATQVPGLSLIPQAGPFSYNNASLQGSRSS